VGADCACCFAACWDIFCIEAEKTAILMPFTNRKGAAKSGFFRC